MARLLIGSNCGCYNSASVEDAEVKCSESGAQGCLRMDWYVAQDLGNREVAKGDWQESEM